MKNAEELTWNVFRYNINSRQMETYNALTGMGEFLKKTKNRYSNKREFAEELNRELMYRYWSKCEWEIQLAPWPYHKEHDEMDKIDVYQQLALNWSQLVDYCWENV